MIDTLFTELTEKRLYVLGFAVQMSMLARKYQRMTHNLYSSLALACYKTIVTVLHSCPQWYMQRT